MGPVLVFDVNETLSDLSPVADRLGSIGAPSGLFERWFAGILRDGFAITTAGGYGAFADLARDGLRGLLPDAGDEAVEHVLGGFAEVDVHPDVPDGIRALRAAGYRLATMTNGSVALTDGLLRRAGVRDCFEQLLDVSGPRRWKPDPRAYRYAVGQLGVSVADAALVAVHPWDVHGARAAGLAGIWIRRGAADAGYPTAMLRPTLAVDDLAGLPRAIEGGDAPPRR